MKQHHDNLELDLQIKKLNREISNQNKNNYNDEYKQLKKTVKLLSDLQVTISEETKVCADRSMLTFYSRHSKPEVLSRLQKKRYELSKDIVGRLELLHFFNGKRSYLNVKKFVITSASYPNPCTKNMPNEKYWISLEGSSIISLANRLKSRYPKKYFASQI